MTTRIKTRPAELVFVEDGNGRRWRGRLLNPDGVLEVVRHWGDVQLVALDHRPQAVIEDLGSDEGIFMRYRLWTQGGHKSGRRYRHFGSLVEAQKNARRWAGRRYRVPEPNDEGND